ncbi:MAG: mycofactocin system transcriptional regulator [Gordonia sp. (in: high G+C Gram-positive bacteria)]
MATTANVGRPPATTRAELGATALELFAAKGFDATSVDDVAAATGLARRTLFRYFPSKNAMVWGDFEDHLDFMRRALRNQPPDTPLGESLRRALIAFNDVPPEYRDQHRTRMTLVLRVPTLQAYSMLMFGEWRQVVAEHVAARLGVQPGEHLPQSIGWQLLGVALAAYEKWVADPEEDLLGLLDAGCTVLVDGLAAVEPAFAE